MTEPTPVRISIGEFAQKMGLDKPYETAQLFGRWVSIVGSDVAAKCQPVWLKQGVLSVRTTSAAWASELRYLAPELIRRVNSELGSSIVTQIKAAVRPQNAPEAESFEAIRSTAEVPCPRPPTEADRIAANIADERVAEAAKKALLAAKMRSEGASRRGTIRRHPEASARPLEDPLKGHLRQPE